MPTLVLGTPPPELEALLGRRRQAGVDRLDEVWQGVRHIVPGPSFEHGRVAHRLAMLLDGPARAGGLIPVMHEVNVGESEHDFRVPDGGLTPPRGIRRVALDGRGRRGVLALALQSSKVAVLRRDPQGPLPKSEAAKMSASLTGTRSRSEQFTTDFFSVDGELKVTEARRWPACPRSGPPTSARTAKRRLNAR